MSSYTRRALHGFAWVSIGVVVANLFGYLLRLLLARHLSVEEYGLVYAIMALFGLVAVFQHLGLAEAITKYVAQYSVNNDLAKIKTAILSAAAITFISTTLIALIAWLAADSLGALYFRNPLAADLVRIYALAFFLSPASVIGMAVLQGRQRLGLSALMSALQSVFIFSITYVLFTFGFGVASALWAHVATAFLLGALLCVAVIAVAVPGVHRTSGQPERKMLGTLLAYGLPVMLTGVAGMILTYTDTALLTFFSTLEQVGIYQAALPTANILLFASTVITTVLLPITADLWARKQKDLMRAALADLYKYAFLLVLPPVLAVVVYPSLVLNLLFGASYIAGGAILRVLAISSFFLILHAINAATLSGIGLPKETTKAVAVGAVLNLAGNLILIPRYGGLGAALATLLSAVVIFSMSTWRLHRAVRMRIPVSAWLRTLLCGLLFCLTLWVVRVTIAGVSQYLKVAIAIALACIIYVLGIMLTRTVTVADVQEVRKRL